jgi:hypothetical protein
MMAASSSSNKLFSSGSSGVAEVETWINADAVASKKGSDNRRNENLR